MQTDQIKAEVEKKLDRVSALRDEVKLKLHLASLDAKQEWDDKLAPRVLDAEQKAKSITESTRSTLSELVAKLESFLVHLSNSDDVPKPDPRQL